MSLTGKYISPADTQAAFYQAFRHCDLPAMKQVWADIDDVVCIHPGSGEVIGYDAVMRSWATIFSDASGPEIMIRTLSKTEDELLAVHVVEERITTGENSYVSVLATNAYRRTGEGWFMISHHGSLVESRTSTHTLQ